MMTPLKKNCANLGYFSLPVKHNKALRCKSAPKAMHHAIHGSSWCKKARW